MYPPTDFHHVDEDFWDGDAVFLEESDIIEEIPIDEEDLPDADEEVSDPESYDEADDSVHTFNGHTGEVYTVACSPVDPTLVATGGEDEKGFLWGIGQGDCAFELTGHTDSISILRFSTDGQLLASGGLDGLVKVWDVASKTLRKDLKGPTDQGVDWVRWHPMKNLVLAGSENHPEARLWDVDNSDEFGQVLYGHTSGVTCGDFTLDGTKFCTGSHDETMRIWDLEKKKTIHIVRGLNYHTKGLTCLTTSADSTLALTGSEDETVGLVSIATGKVVNSLHAHSDGVNCVGFSPSFPWAATGGRDNKLIIWDIQHSSSRITCMHEKVVICLLWLGASPYVATGSADGKVRIWDSRSGICEKTFSGHTKVVESLALSANGYFLVSASRDNTARVFELRQ